MSETNYVTQDTFELLKLRNEVAMLRRNQAALQPAGALAPPTAGAAAVNGPSPDEIGRELGLAVVQGQPGAFAKLSVAEKVISKHDQMSLYDARRR